MPDYIVEQEEYIGRVYSEHSGPIRSFLVRMAGEKAADDILQDVFERFIRESLSGRILKGRELPWLYSVARNRAIDHFRKSQHEESMDTLDRLAAKEVRSDDLLRTIHTIAMEMDPSGQYALLVELLTRRELNQKEIAVILQCSERTVRRMNGKLFTYLKKRLKEFGYGPVLQEKGSLGVIDGIEYT